MVGEDIKRNVDKIPERGSDSQINHSRSFPRENSNGLKIIVRMSLSEVKGKMARFTNIHEV